MHDAARAGDAIEGGEHCHGHDHGPQPAPGTIVRGAKKVFIGGRPAARAGDAGYSPNCCGKVGTILIRSAQEKVYIEGLPAAAVGTPTVHCGTGQGRIASGYAKVRVP